MTDKFLAGSSPWLASLIGDAWAPRPPKPDSDRIQKIANRGLADPGSLSGKDLNDLCAAVVAHGRTRIGL